MIILQPTRLHWVKDNGQDDPLDLCAHSTVLFTIDGRELIRPDDGDWAVSTSALYLLRSISEDRVAKVDSVDQLFPHCGHVLVLVDGGRVFSVVCPTGIDFQVIHERESVHIHTEMGGTFSVKPSEWRDAVFRFTDAVWSFYEQARPKKPVDRSEAEAFRALVSEWRVRRSTA